MKSNIAVKWLRNNEMVANPKTFQAIILHKTYSSNPEGTPININNKIITSKKSVKFLGITIENKLKLDEYINAICKKAAKQQNALNRIK